MPPAACVGNFGPFAYPVATAHAPVAARVPHPSAPLFYRNGIQDNGIQAKDVQAKGIDRSVAPARITKFPQDHHFASQDALALAVRTKSPIWRRRRD